MFLESPTPPPLIMGTHQSATPFQSEPSWILMGGEQGGKCQSITFEFV